MLLVIEPAEKEPELLAELEYAIFPKACLSPDACKVELAREDNNYMLSVCKENKEFGNICITGYLLYYFRDGLFEISRLGVCSGHRRRGHGKLLLNTAMALARSMRLTPILNVEKENYEAFELYKKMGFSVVGMTVNEGKTYYVMKA